MGTQMSTLCLRGWSVLYQLNDKWQEQVQRMERTSEDKMEENKPHEAGTAVKDRSCVHLRDPLLQNGARLCSVSALPPAAWLALPESHRLTVQFRQHLLHLRCSALSHCPYLNTTIHPLLLVGSCLAI